MRKASICLQPAALAAFVAAGATYAVAQSAAPAPGAPAANAPAATDARTDRRADRMERRADRMEKRFGERMQKLKAELKLTPAQEPLFGAVETQLRKMGETRRAERQANRDRFRNAELPDRLDMMSERSARGAAAMRELSGTVKPLWATLSAEQKDIVKKNMPGRGRWGGEGRGEDKGEGRRG